MSIDIRIARPGDNKLLGTLGRKTFYETWREVNTEEDMQAYMKESFEDFALKKEIENRSVYTFMIAFTEKTAAGYTKLRNDRSYPELKDEKALEIQRIYVLKEWQGKKVGQALMDNCLKLAKADNYTCIWLGVNIDNKKAIDFYKSYGFEIFGEKAFQLGKAVDNDYLMKKML